MGDREIQRVTHTISLDGQMTHAALQRYDGEKWVDVKSLPMKMGDATFDLSAPASHEGGVLTLDSLLHVVNDLKTAYAPVEPSILIPPAIYKRIQWWRHLAKMFALPRRKIRKCQMRRRQRFLKRERRRYA